MNTDISVSTYCDYYHFYRMREERGYLNQWKGKQISSPRVYDDQCFIIKVGAIENSSNIRFLKMVLKEKTIFIKVYNRIYI